MVEIKWVVTVSFWFEIIQFTTVAYPQVAQRIIAHPGSKDYGILSVVFQLHAKPKLLFQIPPTVFYPQVTMLWGICQNCFDWPPNPTTSSNITLHSWPTTYSLKYNLPLSAWNLVAKDLEWTSTDFVVFSLQLSNSDGKCWDRVLRCVYIWCLCIDSNSSSLGLGLSANHNHLLLCAT